MALKLNISQSSNLNRLFGAGTVENVYIKIVRYTGEEKICRFLINFYNFEEDDEDQKLRLNFPETVYEFTVNESEDENDFNVRKQGYEYLKTLPEFEGCEDC